MGRMMTKKRQEAQVVVLMVGKRRAGTLLADFGTAVMVSPCERKVIRPERTTGPETKKVRWKREKDMLAQGETSISAAGWPLSSS
jgi:hypothetical protein